MKKYICYFLSIIALTHSFPYIYKQCGTNANPEYWSCWL